MAARTGVRPLALAVIVLAAVHAIHNLALNPQPAVQAACWAAVGMGVFVVVLPPGDRSLKLTGWLLLYLGLTGIALTVGLVLYYAFVVPFLVIAAAYIDLRTASEVALRVVSRMEQADPHAVTVQPHLLRVLEILCRYPYLSNRDIACRLSLSTRSVETYINTLIRATAVDSRRQLVSAYEFYYLAQEDAAEMQPAP